MPNPANLRHADEEAIAAAAEMLGNGKLVAFPTETVYGLGADARNDGAVARIFDAKGRPRFNPLIVHVADIELARTLVTFDTRAETLAATFWPGALTLILPRREDSGLSFLASAGLPTVAVRVPAHALAQRLLSTFGGPVAAPSANASGEVSPTHADHVAASLGDKVDLILDGGPCEIGLESTVLDLSEETPCILRHGAVTLEDLTAAIGPVDDAGNVTADSKGDPRAVKSPGLLLRHYAPSVPLRLGAKDVAPGEALLAFGPEIPAGAHIMCNLSKSSNLIESAGNLFSMLRELDQPGIAGIAVMDIPEQGIGRAINDRLRRAAAAQN